MMSQEMVCPYCGKMKFWLKEGVASSSCPSCFQRWIGVYNEKTLQLDAKTYREEDELKELKEKVDEGVRALESGRSLDHIRKGVGKKFSLKRYWYKLFPRKEIYWMGCSIRIETLFDESYNFIGKKYYHGYVYKQEITDRSIIKKLEELRKTEEKRKVERDLLDAELFAAATEALNRS
jgi:hypothetical protein